MNLTDEGSLESQTLLEEISKINKGEKSVE